MELALRGLGFDPATCYADPVCRAGADVSCYGPMFWTADCQTWQSYTPPAAGTTPLPAPPAVQPPAIDTNPSSPTYGQAIINGVAVGTPADAQALVDAQIAAQAAAGAAAVQTAMGTQASAQCVTQAASCGAFTSVSPDCSTCNFDPSKPAFLIVAVAFLVAMMAWSKKR